MNKVILKSIRMVLGSVGIALMASGSALALGTAAVTIQGPVDNDGEFNGGGEVIDCNQTGTTYGILLDHVNSAHVHSYEVINCKVGVLIEGGSDNHLNDLNLHDNNEDGIRLEGRTTYNHINGSTVSDNGQFGVNLKTGSNFNQFNTMTVSENEYGGYNCDNTTGTETDPPYNKIINNVITSQTLINNHGFGIKLSSDCNYNIIRGAVITNTEGTGIDIKGANNTIQGSTVTGSDSDGIYLHTEANGTLVQSNIASNNGGQGIENKGYNNKFKSNTALNNALKDLQDDNPNCGTNTWTSNTFGTANPLSCIH